MLKLFRQGAIGFIDWLDGWRPCLETAMKNSADEGQRIDGENHLRDENVATANHEPRRNREGHSSDGPAAERRREEPGYQPKD